MILEYLISAINHQMSEKLRFMCFFLTQKHVFNLFLTKNALEIVINLSMTLKTQKTMQKNQNQPKMKNKTKLITVFSQH